MQFKDYYEVLGVKADASDAEIKTAYRRLARKYHPDVSKEGDAEARFKAINEAYEALKDADKRRAYDQLKQRGFRAGDEFTPPPDWAGSAGPGFHFEGEDGAGFSDFFESLFGGGGGRRGGAHRPGPRRGADTRATLQVDLETAFAGGSQRLSLQQGSEARTLEVKIPAGVQSGQVIRLAGQGSAGSSGRGDLLLEIRLAPHRQFEVDGRDVVLRLPIAPWEAALGAEIDVPTLAGRVGLKLPAGSRSGQKLRLKGRGLPGKDGSGDQFVVLEIQTPPAASDAERHAYAAFREGFAGFKPRPAS